jgi:hypothetical protein
MKQTATEFLFEKLWETPKDKLTWNAILEQAKEMESKELNDFFMEGNSMGCRCYDWATDEDFKEYYIEQYDK